MPDAAADDVPAAVVSALRRDDPARTIPLALATLCSIVAGIAGCKTGTAPEDFIEAWGIVAPEEIAEREAEKSAANFAALAARLNERKGLPENGKQQHSGKSPYQRS